MTRQRTRQAALLFSFLLLPATFYFFSPYLILMGASAGIASGSMLTFLLFVASLLAGRVLEWDRVRHLAALDDADRLYRRLGGRVQARRSLLPTARACFGLAACQPTGLLCFALFQRLHDNAG